MRKFFSWSIISLLCTFDSFGRCSKAEEGLVIRINGPIFLSKQLSFFQGSGIFISLRLPTKSKLVRRKKLLFLEVTEVTARKN